MPTATNAHSDHMGGIGQFEDIYLHPADIPRAKAFAASHLVDEAEPPLPQQVFVANCKAQFDKSPDNLFVIPGAVLPDRYAVHRFHPLKPDQVIDLGGRQVQILEERGHTAGEIAVLSPLPISAPFTATCSISGPTHPHSTASTTGISAL